METMEKLFVQIFERKKWIEDQVKRQALLFDQQLASKCLLDGITPPHWLFSASPSELSKKDLISGLLLPQPSLNVPYSSHCCSLYNNPTVRADKGDLPDSIFTQVSALYQGFAAGDRLSVSPRLPLNDVRDASVGVQKGDIDDAKSLPDLGVDKPFEVSPGTSQSLENFQRSKSRQRALALRSNAKLVGSKDKSNGGALAGAITVSEIATLQHEHVLESDLVEYVDFSREICKVEEEKLSKIQGKGNESRIEELISPLNLVMKLKTSHSSLECVPDRRPDTMLEKEELHYASESEIHNSSKKLATEGGQPDLNQFTANDAEFFTSDAASPQDQRSSETPVIDFKPLQSLGRVQRSKSRQQDVKEDNVEQPKEKRSPVDKMDYMDQLMIERSKSSPIGVSPQQHDQVHELELVKIADFDNESCKVEGTQLYDSQKEQSRNIYSGRTKRSRSSAPQPSFMREYSRAGKLAYAGTAGNSVCVPESSEQHVGNRPTDAVSDSQSSLRVDVVKGLDFQSNEKSSSTCSGRVTISQRSVCQPSSVRKSSESSEQQIKENSTDTGRGFASVIVGLLPHLSQNKVGGGQVDDVLTSPSLREDEIVQSIEDRSAVCKMDLVEQLMTEGPKPSPTGISSFEPDHIHESETVKTPDVHNISFKVEGASVYDFMSKEKTSHIHSSRTNRSRRSDQQRGYTEESSHAGSHGYAGRSSRDDNDVGCPVSSEQQNEGKFAALKRGFGFGSGKVGSSPPLKKIMVGDRVIDATCATRSLRSDEDESSVDKMANVEQLVTGESKSSASGSSSREPDPVYELELSKPAEAYCESCVVKEENVDDIHSKENSSNAGSDRMTRYQTRSQQQSSARDSRELGNSAHSRRSCGEDKIACSSELRQISGRKPTPSGSNFSCVAEDLWPQHKRRKVEGLFNHHLSDSGSGREEDVAQPDVQKSPVVERGQSGNCKMKREFQSSHKLQDSEMPLISSFINQASGDPKACSDVEAAVSNTSRIILDLDKQFHMGGNEVQLNLDDKLEQVTTEHFNFPGGVNEGKCHPGEDGKCSKCSTRSPHRGSMEFVGAGQITAEFEGFILETHNGNPCADGEGISFDELDLPKTTLERASVLEQLCKSAFAHTASSNFSTDKLHQVQNLYQSVPNGLLECIDLRNYPSINDSIVNQLKASYSCFAEESNHASQRRNSDKLPFSNARAHQDIRKPFGSPIGKFWDRITSHSASSEKRGHSNPELPCISEENENTDEVADTFHEGISSEVASPAGGLWDCITSNSSSSKKRGFLNAELPFISEEDENTDIVAGFHHDISLKVMRSSVKREPLADISENPNIPSSVSEADICGARYSLESGKTEFSFSEMRNRASQRHGHHTSNKKKHTRLAKMSHGTSLEGNGVNRVSQNSFSRPKLSGKPSLRKGGPSFVDREIKCNNIVSNITSFIPLVQQKQATSTITGKRDVKVKAIEAAEAAKRLAEEKENERRMKKEAMKLERAKLEQENLKQLELQKKKKEEERKKKEADMAARKRQREEEEKREKERKRKRVVEARKQQQEHDLKLRAKKEEERKKKEADMLMNERLNLTKVSKAETRRDCERVKEQGVENLGNMVKTFPKATGSSTSEAGESSTVLQDCDPPTDFGKELMVTSHFEKATGNDLLTKQNQEPSYEISPYKDSDNEEDEDDDRPNTKFIPSWASKRASALIISSLQSVNPEVIFPPRSFCSISEVLLPRIKQLNLKKP